MKTWHIVVPIVLILLFGGWWYITPTETARNIFDTQASVPQGGHEESSSESDAAYQGASIGDENTVEFACASGKSMTAVFARDIVGLTLSDGRQIELRQAISGSGIRYLNNIQTIEFRGSGDDAFLTENGVTTYQDCKALE